MSHEQEAAPACYTPEQWKEYQKFAANPVLKDEPNGYCADCLPEHQAEMKKAGKCPHPDVRFVVEEGGIVGVRVVRFVPPAPRSFGS